MALLLDDQKEGQKKEPAFTKKKKKIIYKYIMVQEKVERPKETRGMREMKRTAVEKKKAVNI